jgi:hypothetical protein
MVLADDNAYDTNPYEQYDRIGKAYYRRLCRDGGYGDPKTDSDLFALVREAAEEGDICFPVSSYNAHGPGTFTVNVHEALKPEDEIADTGSNGIIVVDYQKAAKEFELEGDELVAKVKEVVKTEAKEFEDWANGNVWGFEIIHPQTGEVEDSCWGFIGDPELAIEAAKEAISEPAMTGPPTDLTEAIEAFLQRNETGKITFTRKAIVVEKDSGVKTVIDLNQAPQVLGEDFVPEVIE